jgi:aryl-alcohol dehydrogenase-like predicted oxidoreductase
MTGAARRLGLGTAQFGLDYGVSNRGGRVAEAEVAKILAVAADRGITVLDTAPAYGESEAVLGRLLPQGHPFRIVTKTRACPGECIHREDGRRLKEGVYRSLDRLGVSRLAAVLHHGGFDFAKAGSDHLVAALTEIRGEDLADKIGVSAYTGDEIDRVLTKFTPDLLQLPISVADQRLLRSGHLARLADLGIEIHARSVFLQGLLLMDPTTLPDYFSPLRPYLEGMERRSADLGFDRLETCLAFAFAAREIGCVLIGVVSAEGLLGILRASERIAGAVAPPFPPAPVDPRLLDPRAWPPRPALTA